jgi:hypothetical protein
MMAQTYIFADGFFFWISQLALKNIRINEMTG